MTDSEYNKTVDLYADGIYRFALKHIKNAMSAQDIVQETYTKVWVKHKEVTFAKSKAYLFTILIVNKIAEGRFVAYRIGHKIDHENKPLMYIKWRS